MIWTRNLLIWSQTRYRCATESFLQDSNNFWSYWYCINQSSMALCLQLNGIQRVIKLSAKKYSLPSYSVVSFRSRLSNAGERRVLFSNYKFETEVLKSLLPNQLDINRSRKDIEHSRGHLSYMIVLPTSFSTRTEEKRRTNDALWRKNKDVHSLRTNWHPFVVVSEFECDSIWRPLLNGCIYCTAKCLAEVMEIRISMYCKHDTIIITAESN